MATKEWIRTDESASEMLSRVLGDRPFTLPAPLHRFPLRLGNVVEIAGPSSSAKTDILIQAAVTCILPKEWNGVYIGGMEKLAMFIDLDGRFDILRLSQSIKHRITEAFGRRGGDEELDVFLDEELYAACMRRFLYTCCCDSLELLATLKTLGRQLQKEATRGTSARLLLIDSIGALYWAGRSSTSVPIGGNRKTLSFQTVTEVVVKEIQTLLLVQSMLVLVTKSALFGDTTNSFKRKWSSSNNSKPETATNSFLSTYREYMPTVWQSFVTHRILVRPSELNALMDVHGDCDSSRNPTNSVVYVSKWLLPSLNFKDKFVVRDVRTIITEPDGPVIQAAASRSLARGANLDAILDMLKEVSSVEVTGGRASVSDKVQNLLKEIKKATEKPIAVGFGISNPEHVKLMQNLPEGLKELENFTKVLNSAL